MAGSYAASWLSLQTLEPNPGEILALLLNSSVASGKSWNFFVLQFSHVWGKNKGKADPHLTGSLWRWEGIKYVERTCNGHGIGGFLLRWPNFIFFSPYLVAIIHGRNYERTRWGRKTLLLTCRFSWEKQSHPVPPRRPLGASDPVCWALWPPRQHAYAPFRYMMGLLLGCIILSRFCPENRCSCQLFRKGADLSHRLLSGSDDDDSLLLGYSALGSAKLGEGPIWRD